MSIKTIINRVIRRVQVQEKLAIKASLEEGKGTIISKRTSKEGFVNDLKPISNKIIKRVQKDEKLVIKASLEEGKGTVFSKRSTIKSVKSITQRAQKHEKSAIKTSSAKEKGASKRVSIKSIKPITHSHRLIKRIQDQEKSIRKSTMAEGKETIAPRFFKSRNDSKHNSIEQLLAVTKIPGL